MGSTKTVGSKYEGGLDIAEIAKRVRAEIKAGLKDRTLPAGLKTRVTIARYSGGRSLTIRVTEAEATCFTPPPYTLGERYTAEGTALLAALTALAAAYRYEDSDSHSDYCATNFFLFVNFDSTFEYATRRAVAA